MHLEITGNVLPYGVSEAGNVPKNRAPLTDLGHRWCTQGYASNWVHKYGNARKDANPMLFAPTDFLWDNARARRIGVRSHGERGITTITPPEAGWAEIYADWKSGRGRIGISAGMFTLRM